jgi:hypothetical protein
MNVRADRWIQWTLTGCVALLALLARLVHAHAHAGEAARAAGLPGRAV